MWMCRAKRRLFVTAFCRSHARTGLETKMRNMTQRSPLLDRRASRLDVPHSAVRRALVPCQDTAPRERRGGHGRAALRALIVTMALLAGMAGPAWANLEQGISAYGQGDFATAARELQPLAEDGNAEAQYYVGLIHNLGNGADPAAAATWFRRAAEQSHGSAQLALALLYHEGRGVKHSAADARHWFRRAYVNGVPEATHYLPQRTGRN